MPCHILRANKGIGRKIDGMKPLAYLNQLLAIPKRGSHILPIAAAKDSQCHLAKYSQHKRHRHRVTMSNRILVCRDDSSIWNTLLFTSYLYRTPSCPTTRGLDIRHINSLCTPLSYRTFAILSRYYWLDYPYPFLPVQRCT